jgi:hypothetical protein
MRPKLTYANVMATIAVFIALGGASYAALKVPRNGVGAKQLKKNAVTTAKLKREAVTAAKVRKGTLTGKQVNASTLGIVPTAQTAETANSVAPSEPWHEVGKAGEPQFENGCFEVGSGVGLPSPAFYKDREGVVHLKGNYGCGSVGAQAFQLPPGYRPALNESFPVPLGGEHAIITVIGVSGPGVSSANAGGVVCGLKDQCILHGVTFRAES